MTLRCAHKLKYGVRKLLPAEVPLNQCIASTVMQTD